MTDTMMHMRSLVEQTPDADILRDVISFAAERLMEMEVGNLTGAGYGEKSPGHLVERTGTGTTTGRTELARWNCTFPSSGRAATSSAFLNRAGWPRRHWRQ